MGPVPFIGQPVLTDFVLGSDDKPPLGFIPCPCGWAGLPHYAREGDVQAYRGSPKLYQRRVRLLEKKQAGEEDLSSGVHKWG